MFDELGAALRREADGVSVPPADLDDVLRGGRRRRLVARSAAALAVAALVALGVVSAGALAPDRRQAVVVGDPDEALARLRTLLPQRAHSLVQPDLVLLYEDDGTYHGFYEGIFFHSCPAPTKSSAGSDIRPECFTTALHRTVHDDGTSTDRGSDLLQLPDTSGTEVLYRRAPSLGAIGADSPGACRRQDRFRPLYVCSDGEMTLVRESADDASRSVARLKKVEQLLRERLALLDAQRSAVAADLAKARSRGDRERAQRLASTTADLRKEQRRLLSTLEGLRQRISALRARGSSNAAMREALADLARSVSVPVRLPSPLPNGIRLSDARPISRTSGGGIVLHLEWGTRKHLYVQYGRAEFDGCGGSDRAEVVRVRGAAALALPSPNAKWSSLIWPATRNRAVGVYGLSGNFSVDELLAMAESMHPRPTRLKTSGTAGCR